MHESLLKFKPYVEKGLLREVVSPCGRLVLWNYTDHCTYERAWDEITLNARGTVYEIETGEIVARAFPKFFNYGELDEEKKADILAAKEFDVYEKMDGSLGIIFNYEGEWFVNTRGSFTSDQAVKGKEMLTNKYDMSDIPKNISILAEIIYPENKIIVDYGDTEELVILGSYLTGTNSFLNTCKTISEKSGIRVAPSYKFDSIQSLMDHMATLDHTEEGYVVRLADGYRVKFKSAEYLALARILSHISPLTFWERMENGKIDRSFLESLPEEFRDECDRIADTLEEQYQKTYAEVVGGFERTLKAVNLEPGIENYSNEHRKMVGLYLKNSKCVHKAAIFPYMLGNDNIAAL